MTKRIHIMAASAVLLVFAAGMMTWLLGKDEPQGSADANDTELVALGQRIYAERCASCHGARLEGQPNWRQRLPTGLLPAPPHNETGHTWHHPDSLLFDVTREGGQASAPPGFKSNMPRFADILSDREIWASLAFIKSRWPKAIRDRQNYISILSDRDS